MPTPVTKSKLNIINLILKKKYTFIRNKSKGISKGAFLHLLGLYTI